MSVYRVGTNKSSTNVFPSVRPTLDLDFANTRNLDPRITYSRASGASYIGPDGFIKYAGVNEPRFTYDQNTGESLGLMIEDGGTNLLLSSQNLNISPWIKGSVNIILNSSVSPDNTLTANSIIENTSPNAYHFGSQTITKSATSNTYTFSIFAKAITNNRILGLRVESSGGGCISEFDLNLGANLTAGPYGSGFTLNISSIIKFPNNWYRVSLSVTSNTETSLFLQYYLKNKTTNSAVYTGDGVSGFYLWGAQLETQTSPITVPSSYIPTQASTRTRSRDDTEIRGKNFSDFYNQNGGTVYSDITTITVRGDNTSNNTFDRAYSFTTSNFNLDGIDVALVKAGTQRRYIFGVIENGVDLGSFSLGSGTIESINVFPRAKICVTFQPRNITSYINNNKSPQVFPRKLITCDRLFLGKPQRFQLTPYIIISRFTYYPRQLPEDQIRILTR